MNKIFKIQLAILLVFCSLFGLTAAAADTDDDSIIINGTCGDSLTWTLSNDGVLTISGTGKMYDYYLSSDGYAPWSGYQYKKNKVIIENGVTSIGNYAFVNCTEVTEISIPAGVASIGSNAFYRCINLTDITIPAGVTSIGDSAFFYCSSLKGITIPEGVISIGDNAFLGCDSLSSVYISKSVTEIGKGAFVGCSSLKEVKVSDSGTYSSLNGVLFNNDQTELIYYPTGKTDKSYVIPDGVFSIEAYSFENNTYLTNITIPDSVISVGSYAFENCTNLTGITIPNSVTSIGEQAFYYCTSLKSVTIPNSVKSLGNYAFANCSSLADITLSGSITDINPYTFCECTGLTDIVIPEGIESIGNNAFENCTGLKSISIPVSMKKIEMGAFSWVNLENVYYSGTEDQWNNIEMGEYNLSFAEAAVSYNPINNEISENETKTAENIYNEAEKDLVFDPSVLDTVTDEKSALELLTDIVSEINSEEIISANAKDQLAYLAEELAARASVVNVEDNIVINDEVVKEAAKTAASVAESEEKILKENNLLVRSVKKRVRVSTSKNAAVSITKENLSVNVDSAEAVTPFGSFEFEPSSVSELTADSPETNKISVSFNKNDTSSKVTVKFPNITSDDYKAVIDENGDVIGGKYNPTTYEISAKIDKSGVFTVVRNEKDFSDIKSQPAEVQNAIKKLASKGVIMGTSETEFSPDSSITRAEIAALIVRILDADDPNADGGFSDVTKENWYFGSAGSSKRENIIAGYEDNTFRGTVVIPKVQITSVTARVLENRLGYYSASESILDEFSDVDTIAGWARSDVAIAAYANMVIRRTDGSFEPNMEMTRGDAAVILEKLFDKVW